VPGIISKEATMKKMALAILVSVFIPGLALAAEDIGKEIDADINLNYGFGNSPAYPNSIFKGNATAGVEGGVNVGLQRLGMAASSYKDIEFLARASLGYYNWSEDVYIVHKEEYQRVPIFVGVRGQVPVFTPHVKIYAQAGPELSFDKQQTELFRLVQNTPGVWSTGPMISNTVESRVRIGLTPGVGILFNIYRVYLGLGLSYHAITDPYTNIGVTLGYRF
jgi:hypothetical protein